MDEEGADAEEPGDPAENRRGSYSLDLAAVRSALDAALPCAWQAEPSTGPEAAAWAETLEELANSIAPFSGPRGFGVLELVSEAAGFALFWNAGRDQLGIGMDLSGREATLRFRAGVAAGLRTERVAGSPA